MLRILGASELELTSSPPLLAIVRSIYKMTGQMVKLPEDEDTPEKVSLPCRSSHSSMTERLLTPLFPLVACRQDLQDDGQGQERTA